MTWYHYKLLLPFKDVNKKRELSLKIKSDNKDYKKYDTFITLNKDKNIINKYILENETRDKLETNKKNKVRRRST